MKPQTMHGDNAKFSGNMDTDTKIVMDISFEDRAHLMALLSNLYSDRILACIREYSTNARDAHIMAGVKRAIQVSLPTSMSQYFRVRDYGDGLDIGGLTKYYARYGASAKRDSDDTNGTLGVGCKAALTYSPTFSIVSVHNGIKYNVAITLNEDNIGELNVISQAPSDDPSGVEVSIPVKRSDFWDFERKAKTFYRWWDDTDFTGVYSPYPEIISDLGNGLTTHSKEAVSSDLIIMGGVAYPIPYDGGLLEVNDRKYSIVYHAHMGEVVFAPSRESLMTVAKTKKTIDRVRDIARDNIVKSVLKDVESCTNPLDALVKSWNYRKVYSSLNLALSYRGEPVPEPSSVTWQHQPKIVPIFLADGVTQKKNISGALMTKTTQRSFEFVSRYNGRGVNRRNSVLEDYTGWNNSSLPTFPREHAFVVGAPVEANSSHKKIIREFADIEGASGNATYSSYIFCEDVVGGIWLKGVKVYKWDDIKAVVRASSTTNTFSDRTKYDFYDINGKYESRQIADTEKVLISTPTLSAEYGFNHLAFLQQWAKDLKYDGYAVMGVNRWPKFLREHPNSSAINVEVAKWLSAWYDGMTQDEKDALSVQHMAASGYQHSTHTAKSFDNLLDPDLRLALEACNNETLKKSRQKFEALAGTYQTYIHAVLRDKIMPSDLRPQRPDTSFKNSEASLKMFRTLDYYRVRCTTKYFVEVANAIYTVNQSTGKVIK